MTQLLTLNPNTRSFRWDRTKGVLAEPYTNVLFDPMPIIWFKPVRKDQMTDRGDYECPIYKTSERKGTLSTTGHSTNFVLFLKLPSSKIFTLTMRFNSRQK